VGGAGEGWVGGGVRGGGSNNHKEKTRRLAGSRLLGCAVSSLGQ